MIYELSTITDGRALGKYSIAVRRSKMITPYKNRLELLDIISSRNIKIACEVGVAQGKYANEILSRIPSLDKLYLVDLWAFQENYLDSHNFSNKEQQNQLLKTMANTKPWKEKVEILIGSSTDMAEKIPNNSLDFVYIDARHDYKGCKSDILAYWQKLKAGGIMSGHDYHTADDIPHKSDWSLCADGSRHKGAVKGAVNWFAESIGKQVLVSYKERNFHTWCILK